MSQTFKRSWQDYGKILQDLDKIMARTCQPGGIVER